MTGPRIGPSSIGTPITLITRPTRLTPAVWASSAIPTGMIMPPPKPCSTRKKISDSADQASPQSALPIPNSATEIIQIRFEPKRSVIQPVSGITVASASR